LKNSTKTTYTKSHTIQQKKENMRKDFGLETSLPQERNRVSLLLSFSPCVLMKERSRAASFSRPTSLHTYCLQLAIFCIRIVISVRHDNMVGEVDAHELASPLNGFRQFIVLPAG
jgi:hypothetical protein